MSDNRIMFTVPGRPVPAVRMTQKSKFVDPVAQRYLSYRELVGWTARTKIKIPITGSVVVAVALIFKKGHTGDIDNYVKSILDGCNKIAWKDDRQVVELHAYKRQGNHDTQECAEVWIEELE